MFGRLLHFASFNLNFRVGSRIPPVARGATRGWRRATKKPAARWTHSGAFRSDGGAARHGQPSLVILGAGPKESSAEVVNFALRPFVAVELPGAVRLPEPIRLNTREANLSKHVGCRSAAAAMARYSVRITRPLTLKDVIVLDLSPSQKNQSTVPDKNGTAAVSYSIPEHSAGFASSRTCPAAHVQRFCSSDVYVSAYSGNRFTAMRMIRILVTNFREDQVRCSQCVPIVPASRQARTICARIPCPYRRRNQLVP